MSKTAKLKDITLKIGSGATPKGGESSYQKEGISLIRSQNVLDFQFSRKGLAYINQTQAKELNNVIVEENDILLNITGDSIARSCIVPDDILPARVNQHVAIIRSYVEVDSKYLFYYLQNLKSYLLKICGVGGTRNALTKEVIENLDVVIQSNSKQRAAILHFLDSKIELNNRINAKLEAMAKTLYDYWFVQFDFPDENGKPFKTSGGEMVWNEELKREIPEGWEIKRIKEFASTGSGSTPLKSKKEYYRDGSIPWINSGEVNQPFIISAEKFITEAGLKNSSARIYKKGTILIAMYGATAGKVSFMDIEACTNQAICAINLKSDFHRIYLKFSLERLYNYLVNLSSGSARDNLSQDKIRDLNFIIPPHDIMQSFDNVASSLMDNILANMKQNKCLAELRDWLLPMLMNGQVKVGTSYEVKQESPAIAAEPTAAYHKSNPLTIPDNKKPFAKQVLGGKIVSLFKDDPHFTHIKFQKLQYLAEQIAEADLHWNYYRKQAGPYDPTFMNTVSNKLKVSNWFEEREYTFYPLAKTEQIDRYYQDFFATAKEKLDHLFSHLRAATEATAEMVATLYAVWNDMILKNETVSDDVIVEVFFLWSDRKKNYQPTQVRETLAWMKEVGIVPVGFGYLIKKKKG
jgi:type I restriction enzyme S subunit